MELEVSKRPMFKPTLSTVMVRWALQWEMLKVVLYFKCQGIMAEKCYFNLSLFVAIISS